MNDILTELAIKYGTDKWGKHNYTPFYYEMFKNRRLEVKNVLEIGVAEGASLRMFRDFFPNAIVFGIDNMQERLIGEHRIKTYFGDQAHPESLMDNVDFRGRRFDLIIDDGSHVPEHQVNTCKALMSSLAKNGIYIIEDVEDMTIINKLSNYTVSVPELPLLPRAFTRKWKFDVQKSNNLVIVENKNV